MLLILQPIRPNSTDNVRDKVYFTDMTKVTFETREPDSAECPGGVVADATVAVAAAESSWHFVCGLLSQQCRSSTTPDWVCEQERIQRILSSY